ncbi:hypothetical protein N5P37_006662 [Trichoderma harzianum]|uniref:Zn(2)-C6 fungal-type domain-containing protein n=1 Tax=Trichoderma harzianum CBS 226.95 TaxID=983964 RepID=A0A2T4A358_TRIHA|nr:hypothetical protein M431DRAFT_511551 [Trichoderma harzianum CBS 226.95]KAK0760468.1 hypothetical protein N5P37_006662 [Trichoderma harzianum]PTB51507.1 hypothetical protein M431DRAFT_511551 [Trichoderma harzianum CBS 226.95]
MPRMRKGGCWVCSKRKVKCDSSAPNPCANCERRGVQCQYEQPGRGSVILQQGTGPRSRYMTEAGIPRDRAQRACLNCAARKLKCSSDPIGCQRCLQNELVCTYPETKRAAKRPAEPRQEDAKARKIVSAQPNHLYDDDRNESPASERDLPQAELVAVSPRQHPSLITNNTIHPKEMIRALIDAYFEFVYPLTNHGFIHQGRLLEELDEEKAPVVLLKAMAVSASHFVETSADMTKQATQWADDVDTYIMANMGSYSLLNLQVLVLWANYYYTTGNMGKTWMLVGLAARLAYCLQINVDSANGTPSEKESRRRMMWNLRILDRLLAGTVQEFSVCSKYIDSLRLPCSEHFFMAEIEVETDTLQSFTSRQEVRNISGFAALVGLFEIWREIHLFMKRVSQMMMQVDEMVQQVSALHAKLSDFEQRLPSNLRFTKQNLYLHTNAAEKATFIMLKSWWHECYCNLYRFSLPGFRESVKLASANAPFIQTCRQQVLKSSLEQSIFWRSIANIRGARLSDPIVIVLVHSNTKTLLAIQKLPEADPLKQDYRMSEIPALLASNISSLDWLASRMPRIATVQQGIRNIIRKNIGHASAESIIDAGLPLKRRHSRQELVERHTDEQETQIQAVSGGEYRDTIDSVVSPTIVVEGLNGRFEVTQRMDVEADVLRNRPMDDSGWVRRDDGPENMPSQGHVDDAPILGVYDDEAIKGMAGYVASFEMSSQYDMLFGAWLPGSEEQPSTGNFWTLF